MKSARYCTFCEVNWPPATICVHCPRCNCVTDVTEAPEDQIKSESYARFARLHAKRNAAHIARVNKAFHTIMCGGLDDNDLRIFAALEAEFE